MSIKAILVGLIFDFVSSFLASVILDLLMVLLFHVPLADLRATSPSNLILALNLVVGLACTFGGGYVAGRIGRQDPVLNALLTGAVELVFSAAVLFLLAGFLPLPWWYIAAALLLVVPAAYAGGLCVVQPTARRY